MKKFLLTGTKFIGEIELRYDDAGLLTSYELRAELGEKQREYFLTYLPRCVNDLQALFGKSKTMVITEVKAAPVTFEQFWNRYDDKENSSKKKTQAQWEKLPQAEREKAFRYISKYFSRIPRGTRKKYATTYLSDELWNN